MSAPATTTPPPVQGDPAGLRSAALTWGTSGASAGTAASGVQQAAGAIGVAQFRGPAGTAMRAYVANLHGAAATYADALDAIASAAPRVAEVVETAQRAQRALQRANTALDAARVELAAAQVALAAAQTAAAADPTGSAGRGAVSAAKARVTRAEAHVQQATRTARRAATAFAHADADRQRVCTAFAALVRRNQSIVARTSGAVGSPPSPSASSSLTGELGVLGYGESALETIFGAQLNFARSQLEPTVLRLTSSGLRRLPAIVSPTDEGAETTLEWLDRFDTGLRYIGFTAGIGLPLATSAITAFSNPHLTGQQRQDYIVNHVLLEGGLGLAAGTACAPAGAVAAAACGFAGGEAGQALEKSRLALRVTNGFSHIVVNPFTDVSNNIVHGHYGVAALDAATIFPRTAYNFLTQTFPTPSRVAGIVSDAGHDLGGVGKDLGGVGKDLGHVGSDVGSLASKAWNAL